jgi:O-antigen/teichoic acid export membrane protein
MNNKTIVSKFDIDLLVSFLGQIFLMALGLIVNKILSNYLLISDYAIFNIIRRLITLLSFFLLSGMGISVPRLISIEKVKKNYLSLVSIIISSCQVLLLNIIIIVLIYFIFQNQLHLLISFQGIDISLISLVFYFAILLSFSTLIIAFMRGNDNFFLLNLYSILVNLFVIILLLIIPLNIEVTFIIHIISLFLISFLFIFYFGTKFLNKFSFKFFFSIWPKVYKSLYLYGLPRIPGEIILFGYPIVLLAYINDFYGLTIVAYFSNGFQIITLINAALGFVGIVLLPEVTKLLQLKQYRIINRTIMRLGFLFLLVSLSLSFFVFLFPEFTTLVLYSSNFLDGIYVLKYIVFATIPFSIYLLLRNPIDSISNIPYNTINLVISFIASLFFALTIQTDLGFIISIFMNYFFLGFLTFFTWSILLKKHMKS